MPLTLYEITIPSLLRGLEIVDHYLDVGQAHCASHRIDERVLISSSLYPDMMSLAGQVQRISDTSKGCAARLANISAPSMPDREENFNDLRERVKKTRQFISSVTAEDLSDCEDVVVEMKFQSVNGKMSAKTFVQYIALPNFYFHMSTLHGIFRMNGISVGKRDYFGSVPFLAQ